MGLQGSPASFARLIDYVMRGLPGVLTYIDDVLVHTPDHETQLALLEQTLLRLLMSRGPRRLITRGAH